MSAAVPMTPPPHRFSHAHEARRALGVALAITLGLMAVEAVGGWLAGSLALLADAGHMLVDVGSLGIGLMGSCLAARPATAQMSYGYRRAEILAAMINGVALWAISGAIIFEATQRLRSPHPVAAVGMLAVAALGLGGTLASGAVLGSVHGENLNVRAALVHVLADAAASVGTIAASLVILATGWTPADAVVSFAVAGLILLGSWPLLRDAVGILMEGTPARVALADVARAMCAVPGVRGVHDLHIWSLTAGADAVSGHVSISDLAESQRILSDLGTLLHTRFGLGHVTLQVETEEFAEPWDPRCAPGEGPTSAQ